MSQEYSEGFDDGYEACKKKLWAVYNGYEQNGAVAIVVEAEDETNAEANALNAAVLAGEPAADWHPRRLRVEPFELGKVIELG